MAAPEEKSSWKTPAAVLGIIGALTALGGLYHQHQGDIIENEKLRHQIHQDSLKDAQEYAAKVEEHFRKLDQDQIHQNRLNELDSQIEKLKEAIQNCNDDVARAFTGTGVYLRIQANPKSTKAEKQDAAAKILYCGELSKSATVEKAKFEAQLEAKEKEKSDFIEKAKD